MKRRLLIISIAFCVSFAFMVALSVFSMGRFTTFISLSDQVDHSNAVIINIRSAEMSMKDISICERGYIITRDTMYLRLLNGSIDSVNKCIASIRDMTIDNAAQQKSIALLKASVALRIAAARANIDYADTARMVSRSRYYDDSRQLMKECSQRLRDMRKMETDLLAIRLRGQQYFQQVTNDTLKYLLLIFCFITLVLFVLVLKELRSRMLYQQELQTKVIDLKRSHNELQEIAYVASHDLQEPLRKIQVFSNMLLIQKTETDKEESKKILDRINNSANRMQLLITDLMNLTNLTKTDEFKTAVDMNEVMRSVLYETKARINETGALIETQPLPIIDGYYGQMATLFSALLDNSLKFIRTGVIPVITISYEIVDGHELAEVNPNLGSKRFYRIAFSDNGIGFEKKFSSKIFKIFQRLHAHEAGYDGKGIGLAICQRIMANHDGYITAHGEPDMGAVFKLFFPVEG